MQHAGYYETTEKCVGNRKKEETKKETLRKNENRRNWKARVTQ